MSKEKLDNLLEDLISKNKMRFYGRRYDPREKFPSLNKDDGFITPENILTEFQESINHASEGNKQIGRFLSKSIVEDPNFGYVDFQFPNPESVAHYRRQQGPDQAYISFDPSAHMRSSDRKLDDFLHTFNHEGTHAFEASANGPHHKNSLPKYLASLEAKGKGDNIRKYLMDARKIVADPRFLSYDDDYFHNNQEEVFKKDVANINNGQQVFTFSEASPIVQKYENLTQRPHPYSNLFDEFSTHIMTNLIEPGSKKRWMPNKNAFTNKVFEKKLYDLQNRLKPFWEAEPAYNDALNLFNNSVKNYKERKKIIAQQKEAKLQKKANNRNYEDEQEKHVIPRSIFDPLGSNMEAQESRGQTSQSPSQFGQQSSLQQNLPWLNQQDYSLLGPENYNSLAQRSVISQQNPIRQVPQHAPQMINQQISQEGPFLSRAPNSNQNHLLPYQRYAAGGSISSNYDPYLNTGSTSSGLGSLTDYFNHRYAGGGSIGLGSMGRTFGLYPKIIS